MNPFFKIFGCFLGCANCMTGHADLWDHVKSFDRPSPVHSMKNIDCIYMINLDQRPEKFEQASRELLAYGISPYRFSAVNGWELSLTALNEVGLHYRPGMTPLFSTSYPLEGGGIASADFMQSGTNRGYFGHCASKGSIGIVLSHLSILVNAKKNGYETIWVLEDDIVAEKNPNILSSLIEKLDALVGKDGWDILFTDTDTRLNDGTPVPVEGRAKRPDMDCSMEARYAPEYRIRRPISEDFFHLSARFGAYSMIIRRSGIEKLLKFFEEHKIYLPYDLEYYLPPGIRLYALQNPVVTNLLGALSDNGEAGYLEDADTEQ